MQIALCPSPLHLNLCRMRLGRVPATMLSVRRTKQELSTIMPFLMRTKQQLPDTCDKTADANSFIILAVPTINSTCMDVAGMLWPVRLYATLVYNVVAVSTTASSKNLSCKMPDHLHAVITECYRPCSTTQKSCKLGLESR